MILPRNRTPAGERPPTLHDVETKIIDTSAAPPTIHSEETLILDPTKKR